MAVTGSAGKTTAVALLQHLLSARGLCHAGTTGLNQREPIRRILLSMPRKARSCVVEVSGLPAGNIAESMSFFRPTVGVVINVESDGYHAFRGPDGVAQEKATLVEGLGPGGLAVLNADDPRVLAMRAGTKARVVTFGLGEDADVRGSGITEGWPDRLALSIAARGQVRCVQTPFAGKYFLYPTLAATAVALESGLSLEECAKRIATFAPVFQRLSSHQLRPDVALLLDSYKAPHWSLTATLEVLRSARASRRILIVGSLSDYPGSSSSKYRRLAADALDVADLVWFVGPNARRLTDVAAEEPRVRVAADVRTLCAELPAELRDGDLVLVKGTQGDHLERVLLHATGEIACWKTGCGVTFSSCRSCVQRLIPSASDAHGV